MFNKLTSVSLMALGVAAGASTSKIFGDRNISRHCNQALKGRDHFDIGRTSIATKNRHTGQPHEHRREIARRLRRAA